MKPQILTVYLQNKNMEMSAY